ncbi:hypothetical protein [Intestinibacter bartlettii]|uniref:Uncharacterized protein n=1 Tax=Intestinibacter bartlettii TaxID=261299 RepID=A0ABS6DZG7_9FIRM|nr:hypothetical protein [Intestinibacter bartlettii]MBU5337174.1 hypothetical protein [Intestinibacter bartlettii]MDO5010248.1 hypothetical protein [Intestinibacter bartlettii]
MKKYNRLLGLHLDEVKRFFDNENIKYTITEIRGRKDKEKLIIPRVIKISQKEDSIELIVTYFSDSLL